MEDASSIRERIVANEEYLDSALGTFVGGLTVGDLIKILENVEKTRKIVHFDRKSLKLLEENTTFAEL